MNSHLAGSFSASQGLTSTPTARHPPLTLLSTIQHKQRVCKDPCNMSRAIGGVGVAHMVKRVSTISTLPAAHTSRMGTPCLRTHMTPTPCLAPITLALPTNCHFMM